MKVAQFLKSPSVFVLSFCLDLWYFSHNTDVRDELRSKTQRWIYIIRMSCRRGCRVGNNCVHMIIGLGIDERKCHGRDCSKIIPFFLLQPLLCLNQSAANPLYLHHFRILLAFCLYTFSMNLCKLIFWSKHNSQRNQCTRQNDKDVQSVIKKLTYRNIGLGLYKR